MAEAILPCEGPWASGPREILEHAKHLILTSPTDASRRIGVILVDNAVELTMSVYLGLPRRTNGLSLQRKQIEEMTFNFSKLLEGLETHAPEALDGINLGIVEWYHRLRNQLYHEGNGLTVETRKAEAYLGIAVALHQRLFGEPWDSQPSESSIGEFLVAWAQLHSPELLGDDELRRGGDGVVQMPAFLEASERNEYRYLKNIRNQTVHGDHTTTGEDLTRLLSLLARVRVAALRKSE